jgi:hypothetical protein
LPPGAHWIGWFVPGHPGYIGRYYCKLLGRNVGDLTQQLTTIRSFAKTRAAYILEFTDEVFGKYE